jgi:tRNA G18 (ribose-2'-O)-methylase SpoU
VARPALALQHGFVVAEGRLVVARLIRERRCRVRSVLMTPAARDASADVIEMLAADVPVYLVDQAVLAAAAGFNFHRGCLAIADRPAPVPPAALAAADLVVALERCGNVDNMGGIFRSAAAFDVDAVLLSPGCCDPLYRKSIRTSMGAALSVPFVHLPEWPAPLADLQARGFTLVATTPAPAAATLNDVFRSGRPRRVALLAGSEGDGLSEAAMAMADIRVRIPISPRVDSLNVAVAVSIVLARLSASPVSGKT